MPCAAPPKPRGDGSGESRRATSRLRYARGGPRRYCWSPLRTSTAKTKSKNTPDRRVPGAFEGETLTRRRFMTGWLTPPGGIALPPFVLPALGFAIGRSAGHPTPLGRHRPTEMFTEDDTPLVLTLTPGFGEAGKATGVRAQVGPGDRHRPLRPGLPLHRLFSNRLRAPRLPGALVEAASGSSALATEGSTTCSAAGWAARRCGRWTASRPRRPRRVQVGPRFLVNSELSRFSPRDPGSRSTASASTCTSRPGAKRRRACPLPKLPPRRCPPR